MLEIGSMIRKKREAKGWTQKELGEKLFVSDKTISRYENNQNFPDISMLLDIARVLEFDYQELIEGNAYIEKKEKKKQQRYRLSLITLAVFIVILIGMICFDAYYDDQKSLIHEQGINYIVSKKWNEIGITPSLEAQKKEMEKTPNQVTGYSVWFNQTEYQKQEILEYLEVDHWISLKNKPIDVTYTNMMFDFATDNAMYEYAYICCQLYKNDENYFIHLVNENQWYQCPKDISGLYDFYNNLSRQEIDLNHPFENLSDFEVVEAYHHDDHYSQIGGQVDEDSFTIQIHENYMIIETQTLDIQSVDIKSAQLILKGDSRMYTKPYRIILEMDKKIVISQIFFNDKLVREIG